MWILESFTNELVNREMWTEHAILVLCTKKGALEAGWVFARLAVSDVLRWQLNNPRYICEDGCNGSNIKNIYLIEAQNILHGS